MTKSELIANTAKNAGMTKKNVAAVLDAILDTAGAALMEGEELHISGVGIFSVREKEAYTARNPKTNQPVEMPATKRITFIPSKALKEKINET